VVRDLGAEVILRCTASAHLALPEVSWARRTSPLSAWSQARHPCTRTGVLLWSLSCLFAANTSRPFFHFVFPFWCVRVHKCIMTVISASASVHAVNQTSGLLMEKFHLGYFCHFSQFYWAAQRRLHQLSPSSIYLMDQAVNQTTGYLMEKINLGYFFHFNQFYWAAQRRLHQLRPSSVSCIISQNLNQIQA